MRKPRRSLGVVLMASALSATMATTMTMARAADDPPPAPVETVRVAYRGLVISGGVIFGISWSFAAAISLLASDTPDGGQSSSLRTLAIPVAGPALYYSHPHDSFAFGLAWTAIEAAGATMLITGLAGHDVERPRRSSRAFVVPIQSRNLTGLALRASF